MKLATWNNGDKHLRIEFKKEDAWIGAFWRWEKDTWDIWRFHLWVCLIPCFPFHYTLVEVGLRTNDG